MILLSDAEFRLRCLVAEGDADGAVALLHQVVNQRVAESVAHRANMRLERLTAKIREVSSERSNGY